MSALDAAYKAAWAAECKARGCEPHELPRDAVAALQEGLRRQYVDLADTRPERIGPPPAPRSQPLNRPEPERCTDDQHVLCPECHEAMPHNKYPTDKHGVRDYRACRPCIRARREQRKATTTN